MAKDYYQILGVEKNASGDEIKKAFRKLAHQHHPDKGGDPEKFKEINEAFQVLGDPQKRQQFDQFGQTFEGAQGSGFGGFGGFDPFGAGQGGFNVNFEDLGGLGDIFSQFFGGQAGGRTAGRERARGGDLQVEMAISFDEMVFGTERELPLNRWRTCSRCHGNLAEPGTKIETCKTCKGSGHIQTQTKTILGSFVQRSVCPECRGEGKSVKEKCHECRGEGRIRQFETLVVKIPAGIETGTTLRVTGEGEAPAYGGTVGNLYVLVKVKADKKFRREGSDIFSEASLPFALAALGGKTEIETVDGKEEVNIPKGTQSGEEILIRGKGIGRKDGARGNQKVKVSIEVPKKLTKKQEELLKEFSEAGKKGFKFF